MSGGFFDYKQYGIEQMAADIEQLVVNNNSAAVNEYGAPTANNFSPDTIEEFKVAVRILRNAFVYAQRIDYLVCADDGEESFHIRLAEELAHNAARIPVESTNH